jgi:hypothetical protein
MKTLSIFILLFCFLNIISCENNSEELIIDENNKLLGSWINPEYNNSEIKFERVDSLKENEYGISFLKGDVFIERSSGWCGTPPLSYFDYQGNWEKDDLIVEIDIDMGLGSNNRVWKIKSINNSYLIIIKD